MCDSGEVRPTKAGLEQGPWNKHKIFSAKNVRPPKADPQLLTLNTSEDSTEKLADLLRKSTLNVNAQEFIPKSQLPTPEDMVYLNEAIEVVTMNPGRYEEFLPPIEDIVESLLEDSSALAQIIEVILEQCIVEPNFRYTGARLCRNLAEKFSLPFLSCLIKRCGQRFSQLADLVENDLRRMTGFSMLLAELYLQITISQEGERIKHFASGLHEIITRLLSIPSYDTVRTVIQILKLCGLTLEEDNIPMHPVYRELEELMANPAVEENVSRIIAGFLQMRRTEWCTQVPETPAIPQNVAESSTEPVFYSPDGQVMSEEERSFLYDNIPISEDLDDYIVENPMDDEASAAFDEFVSFTQSNSNYLP